MPKANQETSVQTLELKVPAGEEVKQEEVTLPVSELDKPWDEEVKVEFDAMLDQLETQADKPVLEYVLPVGSELVVGVPAYIRVLAPNDTKFILSNPTTLTDEVVKIVEDGFETATAWYKEVK